MRRRGLGSTVCKPPERRWDDDPPIEKCGTDKKGMTLCVGDRVARLPVKDRGKLLKFPKHGTVLGVQMGANNSGKKSRT